MEIIINFTPTGMIPTKNNTPYIPISVSEIVEDVHKAYEIGITVVHLHARNLHTEEPTYKSDVYGQIISGIRKFSEKLIISVSLSGRTFKKFKERAEVLSLDGRVKPDMGSLTLSSLNFNRQVSMNSPEMIKNLAIEMKKRGILPELEAFDSGMINYAKYLERKGIIESPYYFNLIIGNIACAQSDLLHVGVMVRDLPFNSFYSLGGIGNFQLAINSVAISMGYGVRVGLEDNIYYDLKRSQLAKNEDLLNRIHSLINSNENKYMTSQKLRSLLKLEPGNGSYGRFFRKK